MERKEGGGRGGGGGRSKARKLRAFNTESFSYLLLSLSNLCERKEKNVKWIGIRSEALERFFYNISNPS